MIEEDPDRSRQSLPQARRLAWCQPPLEPLELDVAEQLAQDLTEGEKRFARASMGVAAASNDDEIGYRIEGLSFECAEEHRLARARLTDDKNHLSRPHLGVIEMAQQLLELLGAANTRLPERTVNRTGRQFGNVGSSLGKATGTNVVDHGLRRRARRDAEFGPERCRKLIGMDERRATLVFESQQPNERAARLLVPGVETDPVTYVVDGQSTLARSLAEFGKTAQRPRRCLVYRTPHGQHPRVPGFAQLYVKSSKERSSSQHDRGLPGGNRTRLERTERGQPFEVRQIHPNVVVVVERDVGPRCDEHRAHRIDVAKDATQRREAVPKVASRSTGGSVGPQQLRKHRSGQRTTRLGRDAGQERPSGTGFEAVDQSIIDRYLEPSQEPYRKPGHPCAPIVVSADRPRAVHAFLLDDVARAYEGSIPTKRGERHEDCRTND